MANLKVRLKPSFLYESTLYKSWRYNSSCIIKIKIPTIRKNTTKWSKSEERPWLIPTNIYSKKIKTIGLKHSLSFSGFPWYPRGIREYAKLRGLRGAWVGWVIFLLGLRGLHGSKYLLPGSTCYVGHKFNLRCMGQIYFCVGQNSLRGSIFLCGSTIFAWV